MSAVSVTSSGARTVVVIDGVVVYDSGAAHDGESAQADAKAAEEEVTEEMIKAGINEWSLFDKGDRLDWMVSAIYTAMQRARRGIHNAAPSIPTDESCRKALRVFLSSRNNLELRNTK